MALIGTLRSWNDERGFGFIAPSHGGAEVFVHATAFPRDGTKPSVGERLSFELDRGRDGRPRAVRVVRLALGPTRPPQRAPAQAARPAGRWPAALVTAVLLVVAVAWAGRWLEASRHRRALAAQPPLPAAVVPDRSNTPAALRCDGRTHCTQMTSCEEAKWFIQHCPGTRMDGNHDGVPCQEQWCN